MQIFQLCETTLLLNYKCENIIIQFCYFYERHIKLRFFFQQYNFSLFIIFRTSYKQLIACIIYIIKSIT